MIDFVQPEDCNVTQRRSQTLTQHPLVLLDQQLRSLVREDDDAIVQSQPPRGRRWTHKYSDALLEMRRHPPARKSYRHEVWRLDPPIRMLQLWASLAFGGQATTCDRCLTRDKRSEFTLDPGPYNLCNRRDTMKHMQTGLLLGSAPFRRQNSRQAI